MRKQLLRSNGKISLHMVHLHLLGEEPTEPSASNGVSRCFVRLTGIAHESPVREVLIKAGLGPKTFSVPLCSSGEEFREIILSNFPKFRDGEGLDLLCCIPNTKHLDVISPSVAQSERLLKAAVRNVRFTSDRLR